MATKAQVIKILTKQKAEWEIESRDPFTFSAWLQDDLIWASGYDCGIVTQEKDENESWSQFWDDILSVIDAEVITRNKGKE